MSRHRLASIGGACGVVALLAVGALVIAQRRRDAGGAALERLGSERTLLARISADDHWSRCAPLPRVPKGYCRTAEDVSRSVGPRRLAALATRGGEGVEGRPVLASLLLRRDADHLEQAVARLEAIARRAPGAADPLVDLAAAQLTAGWAQGSAESFVDALESADRAVAIEPANARACFNRAFALEELGLREFAMAGWDRCTRLEEDPQWRAEALQRASALRTLVTAPSREAIKSALDEAVRDDRLDELDRLARAHPHRVTDIVARDLFPKWVAAGPIEQASWWLALIRLEKRVGANDKNRLLLDLLRQTRTALASGRGPELTDGVRRLREGLDAYRKREYNDAIAPLRASGLRLQAVPALQIVARVYGAIALHSSGQVDAAREELLRLVQDAGERRYVWPLGLAQWTLGRMAIIEGQPVVALRRYHQALHAFERIGAEELVLSAHVLLAETFSELGQSEQSWRSARRALLAAHRLGASDRLFFVSNLLAGIADEQGRPGLAIYAQTSAIAHGAAEPPRTRANAHLWRACFLGREGLHEAAQQDLRLAEELAPSVADPSESARLDAEIALAHGVLDLQRDPKAAATWLGRAVDRFNEAGDRFAWLVALRTRADAFRKTGQVEKAVADLERAASSYDATLRDVARPDDKSSDLTRLAYLRQKADVYQGVVNLYVEDLDSPWAALIFAEHTKSLWAPATLPQPSDERDVDEWSRALPPGTALVSYAVAGERIVAWVLTPADRRFFELAPAAEVATLTDRLDRAPDADAWDALARELYRRLVAPLAEPLGGARRLLIVPTPGLDRVPFAGLLDPQSGRYLAETHLLEMLPSVSALSRGAGRPETAGSGRALVVGDPRPTSAALLGLPALRFAAQEAREAAAALGPDATLLVGGEATPGRFVEEAVGAEVIHVAGHALPLGRSADSAALVLATSPGEEDGLLTAREILLLPLAGTDLVVLSSCSSAGDRGGSWQSGLTLARSFLSAGADRVVATLHAMDDEESAALFRTFHRELAADEGAAASLRSAQLDALRWRAETGRSTPPSWPYVVTLGSGPSR
jgi:tetratricopeptide (TPR) repeat protein